MEDTVEQEKQEDELLLMVHVDVKQQKENEYFLNFGWSNHMSGNKNGSHG